MQQPVAQRLRLGSARAVSCRSRVWAQASRSTAIMVTVSQAALIANHADWAVAQAGVAAAADAVLDSGVGAVAGIQVGVLPDAGVGGEGGVAVAVGLLDQIQLRAGVRAFAAHDHPRPGRIARQDGGGQQAGDLGDAAPSTGRCSPSASIAGAQSVAPEQRDGGVLVPGDGPADGERTAHRLLAQRAKVGEERLGAPGASARTRIGCPCRWWSGIWASAASSTAMWSAAVLLPALPVRSAAARNSPVLSRRPAGGDSRRCACSLH